MIDDRWLMDDWWIWMMDDVWGWWCIMMDEDVCYDDDCDDGDDDHADDDMMMHQRVADQNNWK